MVNLINIFIDTSDQCGYIWDINDWLKVRVDHRIIGNLVGNSTSKRESSHELPALLLPEEVTLLKEKNLARLVCCPSCDNSNDKDLKKIFLEKGNTLSAVLKNLYLEKRKKELEEKINFIIQGKKKKYPNIGENDKQTIINEELEKSKILCEKNKQLLINSDDILIDETKLVDAKWTYPNTEKEKLRYEVYKDLWEKNYCLSCGNKFGGDFLCYIGDPLDYHASYIVVCKTNDDEICCKALISHGRVGTCTRKVVVIATKNFEKNENHITYLTLRWVENRRKM